ncbi:unnamed protein product [Rodentolepis nana]|uniref:Tr-type G domain-containing protein n=1 Tax=Rodentolepis nana TaxID=102285 RepID=A0A3P7RZV6_RODNA|nr:unnamed protein product [Rodentolepis nana]
MHCPQIPNDLEGGGQVRYSLQTHNDATGATVAIAEAACPPNTFFFPSAKAAEIEATNEIIPSPTPENLGTLQNQLLLTCDHHSNTWVPSLPAGGCMTRARISALLQELVNSKMPKTTTTLTADVATASPEVTLMNATEVEESTTPAAEAELESSNITTPEIPIFVGPETPAAILSENVSDFLEGTHLSHGSSANIGIFILNCNLCKYPAHILNLRCRLSRLVRSKLAPSNTLPGRFPGSGMFMNTLSGSLTFSRHRKNPYFSPSHHPTVLMSQSAVSIPNHHLVPQQTQPWFDNASLRPTSNAVSLGNLHIPKSQPLPRPSPTPIPPPDLDLLNSDTYTMQQSYQFSNHQQQSRPQSSVHTQNSASMSTRRQTLLSADTMTTNVSAGGQPSPSIALGYHGVSTDVLGEAFTESPDANQVHCTVFQVFSATLPWKSKPQGGITGGLKRLSTFIRSAMTGSSASFHSHHSSQSGGSHPGQQIGPAMQASGLFTRRQQYAGSGWPSSSLASSATPGTNSMGLLSSGQSRSSYTSEATLQPISPLSSLGRSSLGHIASDRKPQLCLMDPFLCRLNHQHTRGDQQQGPVLTNGNLGGGSMMKRGNRESTPLPPLPPQHPHHSNSNSSGPTSHLLQNHGTTVLENKGKTGTLNMDTYLEPIDGADTMGQQGTNAGVEDFSVTEIISGGTLSEDSDTGNQASWQSDSPDGANGETNENAVGLQDTPRGILPSSKNGVTTDYAGGIGDGVSATAPIAMSDPTVSIGEGSFDEDSPAADYFTYDENRRSNVKKKNDKVIRRPRLSPPSTKSRPLSDAMLSNHYYDKSELLSPDMIPGLDGAPEALFDPQFHDPGSRPTSVGVYSNDDEEVDEDEESSLYEAVDRRARKVGTLPPAPHPPSSPQIPTSPQQHANAIQMRIFVAPSESDLECLNQCLAQRLLAGQGECFVEIGVGEGQDPGISPSDMAASEATLQSLAEKLNAHVIHLRCRNVSSHPGSSNTTSNSTSNPVPTKSTTPIANSDTTATQFKKKKSGHNSFGTVTSTSNESNSSSTEKTSSQSTTATSGGEWIVKDFLLRQVISEQDFIDIRVAVVGNVDAGKSTMLGVLTHGELDNGRGKVRQYLFRHKHEIESGRTSSVGNDILGFDADGVVVNRPVHGKLDWAQVCQEATKVS